jgi:hypothetical protein
VADSVEKTVRSVGTYSFMDPKFNFLICYEVKMAKTSSQTSRNNKSKAIIWVPIVVALISLSGVIFSTIYRNKVVSTPTPTPTPTQTPGSFSYLVRVEAKDTGEYVPNAQVTMDVDGKAPLDGITDSNGVARIFIESSYAGQPGFLIVEASGYETHKQHIDLVVGALPDVVQLKLEP